MSFFKNTLLFSVFILTLNACGTKTEGCTDPSARDFNAAADKDCNCCKYFQLQMKWNLFMSRFESESFAFGDTLQDAAGNDFQVLACPFYISDWRLVSLDNREIGPKSNNLNCGLVQPSKFIYDFGDVAELTTVNRVRFNVGLNATLNHGDVTDYATTTALGNRSMYLSADDGYIFMLPQVVIGVDTFTFPISGDANLTAIELPLRSDFEMSGDKDNTINVSVNYRKLFSGVDFATDTANDAAVLKQKIIQNLSNEVFRAEM